MSDDAEAPGGTLRTEAQRRLRRPERYVPSSGATDAQLLEELKIHQVELELQNDELQRSQRALAHSQRAYAELFDLAPLPHLLLDAGGRILEANRAASPLLSGRQPKTTLPSLVSVNARGPLASWLQALGDEVESREVELRQPGGTLGIGHLRGRRLASGGFVVCLEDVTERRRLERALERSERDLRRLTSLAPDAMCVCQGGDLIYANEAFLGLAGTSLEKALGQPLLNFFHPDDKSTLESFFLDAGNPDPRPTVRIVRSDEVDHAVELRTMSMVYAGRPAVVLVGRDLTERRRLAARLEQTERLATVGMLVSGVAHEINNPMAYAVSNLEALLEDLRAGRLVKEEGLAMTRDALEGVQRVVDIVGDLRSFQRVEDHLDVVSPNDVIAQTLRLAEGEVSSRASLRRDLGEVPNIVANESRLGQVLLNLVLNAAQALEGSSPSTAFVRVRTWQDGRDVCIAVEDNGPGIPAEHQAHLFDPFFTTRRSEGGTGLGLAISNSLVQHMGGFIEVDSELGKGSRFVVRLPIDAGEEETTRRPRPTHEGLPPGPHRVLAVDDERAILRALRRLLRHDVELVTAGSGREAMELLAEDDSFDAILCDLVMTDGNGNDVATWVRDQSPTLTERLIFMTGMPHPDVPLDGSSPVLLKPFSRGSLEDVLRLVLVPSSPEAPAAP